MTQKASKDAGKAVQQMRDAGCHVVFFHNRRLKHIGIFDAATTGSSW